MLRFAFLILIVFVGLSIAQSTREVVVNASEVVGVLKNLQGNVNYHIDDMVL